MRPRARHDVRARAIIDRLELRLEGQTLKPGADDVACTAIVGTFHTQAGRLEHDLRASYVPFAIVAVWIRTLRRIVETHRLIRRSVAMRRHLQQQAVQEAIKRAKRGAT